jgi:kynurenine formamidase
MKRLALQLAFVLITSFVIADAQRRSVGFPSGTIVDLSYPFDSATVYWPTAESFHLEKDFEGIKNVPALENVANLDKLSIKGFSVIALPMKIKAGSGGPLRIVAIVPERK